MGYNNYIKLLKASAEITEPTEDDVAKYMENNLSKEDAVIAVLKDKYIKVALENGFTEDQGLAMLEYAAINEEIEDEV